MRGSRRRQQNPSADPPPRPIHKRQLFKPQVALTPSACGGRQPAAGGLQGDCVTHCLITEHWGIELAAFPREYCLRLTRRGEHLAFVIDGPYKLRIGHLREPDSDIHVRYVRRRESLQKLRGVRVATRAGGLYIFAIRRRGKGAGIPWYVGINEGRRHSSLYKEALTNEKLRKYARALAEEDSGSSLLYFLSPEDRRSDHIPEMETFLIWLARQRNPRLLNRKKVRLSPNSLNWHLQQHRIVGILGQRRGRTPKEASGFRKMIGWDRAMHVGPSGD